MEYYVEHVDFDAECWEEAIREYNTSLTSGSRTTAKKKQKLNIDWDQKTASITAKHLLDEAIAVQKTSSFKDRRRPAAWLLKMTNFFTRYARCIDILSQVHPGVSDVLWGSVRAVLEVVNDAQDAGRIAAEGLVELTRLFDRWKLIASVEFKKQSIKKPMVRLYKEVLEFLLSAQTYLGAHPLRRAAKSVLGATTLRNEFQGKLDKFKAAARDLEAEFNIHGTKENLQYHRDNAEKLETLESTLPNRVVEPFDTATWKKDLFHSQYAAISRDTNRTWLARAAEIVSNGTAFQPFAGTCRWFESHPEVIRWRDREKPELLWVQGGLGCGKSVSSYRMASWLRELHVPVIFCSFRGSVEQRASTASSFAASLLYHLLGMAPDGVADSIWNSLADLSNGYPSGPQACAFQGLWTLCLQASKLLRAAQHFLIIDGLDECDFDEHYFPLNEFILQLKSLWSEAPVWVAIFSRPLPEADQFSLCHRVCINTELLAYDTRLYVLAALRYLKNIPPEYHETVLQKICLGANGCILWAKLYLEYLNEPCQLTDFQERLQQNCPPQLDDVYDRLIRESKYSKNIRLLAQRESLLQLVCEAQQPLSLKEVASMLSLQHVDYREVIREMGSPFLSVSDTRIEFVHCSAKAYITKPSPAPEVGQVLVRPEQSHGRLAYHCLIRLLEDQYASKDRIGYLLHRNYRTKDVLVQELDSDEISYEYARQYWDLHIVAVTNPGEDLLHLLCKFLQAAQFVYWGEDVWYHAGGNLSRVQGAELRLNKWLAHLTDEKKVLVEIENYFVTPYLDLCKIYKKFRDDDRELEWLTQFRLGIYRTNKGETSEAACIMEEVAKGLTGVLGLKSPLTLEAKSLRALLELQLGNYSIAFGEFCRIAEAQEAIFGEDDFSLYTTIMYKGEAEYLMNRYEQSIKTQEHAAQGLLPITGKYSNEYLGAEMWKAYGLVEIGDLTTAHDILSAVFHKRKEKRGNGDILASVAQYWMGDIERKLMRQNESIRNLTEAFETRRRAFKPNQIWLMDCAISKLVAFRDFGKRDEANSTLDTLDREGEVSRFFDRNCQVTHLRALLISDDGDVSTAILLLERLLVETDRKDYNRYLLWIILDLAVLLRARGDEGDEQQAMSNFDNIIVDRSTDSVGKKNLPYNSSENGGGGDHEPDPPRLLMLAEQALILVRNRSFDKLQDMFKAENVSWTRPEDLWISYGAPAADTAWMRGPLSTSRP